MKVARSLTVFLVVMALLAAGTAPVLAQAPQGGPPGAQRGGGGGGGQGRGGGRGPQTPPVLMTTTAFEDGGVIPAKYVGQMGVSPELKWSQVPMAAQSFVLVMHDPEPVLMGAVFGVLHWLVWNIPASSTGLAEGLAQGAELPDGTRQVSLRGNGYMGPGAPPGPYHHYTFTLYALDTKLDIPQATPQQAAATYQAVMQAMEGHVLGKAILVGRFHQ